MPGLSMKETRRLIEHIQPQGVTATKTKNGLLLRLPNGDSTVVHYSVSDYRGPQKLRAQLKRAGVTWPTDPGRHVQKSKPSKLTQERGNAAVRQLGDVDSVTTREMALAMGLDPRKNAAQVRRYLDWAGWEPVGNTLNARWLRPLPDDATDPFPSNVTELPTAAAPEVATEAPEVATPEVAPEPEPEPEPQPEAAEAPAGREFIDTADSWTADWDQLPEDWTVGTIRTMFAALGLNVELRTWRP